MYSIRSIFVLLTIIALAGLVGCSGGSGGSAAPVAKDVAGINATLSGFMNSIAARDSQTANQYLAQTSGTSESGVKTLMVYDFGADIYNPNDERSHYPFTVSDSDIAQPTDSLATVKAYYKLSNGQPLYLTFALIKENGVWTIETITVSNTIDYSSGFVPSTYFPIVPGAYATYANYYNGVEQSSRMTKTFASSPTPKDGMDFYLVTTTYPNTSILGALRAGSAPTFSGSEIYYSQQSSGLWTYASTMNGGVPFKIFESFHAFGSDYSITYTTGDASTGGVTNHTTRMTFGYPQSYPTSLGTFNAVPVEMVDTAVSGSGEYTSKAVIWFAPSVGQVGTDMYSRPTDSSPTYQDKIVDRTGATQPTTPTTPTTPTNPTPTYSVLYTQNASTVAVGSHYEATYSVVPSGATTITGVTIESVTPNTTQYPPWAGFDSYYNAYLLSVTPGAAGSYICIVNVATADGLSHRITHDFAATAAGL
ncbi:MAG: hypothetical protein ACOYXC_20125 [Candidatus Rifleibacteriota bacterium]